MCPLYTLGVIASPLGKNVVSRCTSLHTDIERLIEREANPTYILPPKNRHFVGRTRELQVLKDKLIEHQDCQRMSVVGLGGTGKTQIVLRFAYWIKEEAQSDLSIFWMPALSMETFEQACTEIVHQLEIPRTGEEDVKDLLQSYLSTPRSGRWLLVVDNVDDSNIALGNAQTKGIVDYLPEREDGMIVFTTRTLEIATSLTQADVLELDAMNRVDAANFFRTLLVKKDVLHDELRTSELLEKLAYLPLAIAQAAAYMNMNRISLVQYLQLFSDTEPDIVDSISREFRDDSRYKDEPNAIATTWQISFNLIRKRDKLAADLLSFMACIGWEAIPRSILPSTHSQERMEGAIGMLCEYSFLSRREIHNEGGINQNEEVQYDMHRLVHLATRIWISQTGDVNKIRGQAVNHLIRIIPDDDYSNQGVWAAYMPHALRLLEDRQGLDAEPFANLCLFVGKRLRMDGRIGEAIHWVEECGRWCKNLEEDDPLRLSVEQVLAEIYVTGSRPKEAIQILERILAIQTKRGPIDDQETLESKNILARAYLGNLELQKAIQLFEHIVAIQQESLPQENLTRLSAERELARAYDLGGQTDRATKILQTVVAVQRRTLAEDHPNRLTSEQVLATIYINSKQFSQAIEQLEYVLILRVKSQVADHPDVLAAQYELARAYLGDNNSKKAIELLEHVVSISNLVRVEENQDRLDAEQTLANAYFQDGQVKRAINLLTYVVDIQEHIFEESHQDSLFSKRTLALAYREDGQTRRALALLEDIVKIMRRHCDTRDFVRLLCEQDLGYTYLEDGQFKCAIEIFESIISLWKEVEIKEPGRVLSLRHNLAIAYFYHDHIHDAIELMEDVAEDSRALLDEDDPERHVSEAWLPIMYEERDKISSASCRLICN